MRILYRKKKGSPVTIKHGALYNWYAVNDARGIAPPGWRVPTKTDFVTLTQFVQPGWVWGANTAGLHLREAGTSHWAAPNTGADNSSGFCGLPGGNRGWNANADFWGLSTNLWLWNITEYGADGRLSTLRWDNAKFETSASNDWEIFNAPKRTGCSVRLIKNDSTDPGTVTDIEGNIYPTVKIGSQVWMLCNLIVKKYNNGEDIPKLTLAADWIATSAGAWCAWGNDDSNI